MLPLGEISEQQHPKYEHITTFIKKKKFNFWNAHRIMNTSGRIQDSMKRSKNIYLLLIFTFHYKYLKVKIIFLF